MSEPHLVTPDDPTWSHVVDNVDNVDRRLAEVMNFAQGKGRHWAEAWVWGADPPWGIQYGFGVFDKPDIWSDWVLKHVYFAPSMLRGGRLPAVWPMWCERYGAFGVERPGEAMQAFLAARGYAPRHFPVAIVNGGQQQNAREIDTGYPGTCWVSL